MAASFLSSSLRAARSSSAHMDRDAEDDNSSLYRPDPAALQDHGSEWGTAFLTQRDVGLLVPINYHTGPWVSLRAACFARRRYEDASLKKCFSNLLGVGFRRFVVDVYWDAPRGVWGLCPVGLGTLVQEEERSLREGRLDLVEWDAGYTTTDNVGLLGKEVVTLSPGGALRVHARQDGAVSSSSSVTATSQSLPGTSTTAPTTEALSNASTALTAEESSSVPATSSALPELTQDEAGLYQLGNYSCSPTVTLNRLDDILEAYLDDSDLTTDATITYLVLNLHAAADPFSPSTPAQKPPPFQMPHDETLISHIINGNLSNKVIYTPQELREDRKDLNASWFDVQWDNKPAAGYYNTSQDKDDQYSTDDGWPTETFIEFGEFQRILVGFGDVDPQMEDYNLSADGGVIFGPNELFKNHKTTYGSSGNIRSGCLYSSASPNRAPSPLTANTSWALSTFPPPKLSANPNTTNPIPSINSLTTCGLSPYLNTSLANNLTADDHPTPYLAITHSTLWSWAPGEPKNSTNPDNHSSSRNTCAVISSSGAYPGRWRTADCRVSRRIACQSLSSPWTWHISSQTATYRHAFDIESSLCPAGYHFSVPHTALENRYLSSALSSSPSPNTEKTEIFVNINSLDTPQCWTLGGPNATCPYMPRVRMNQARIVVIPTIAAVIIFVLAALTFFVKCASNRREMRRGKRRREGWGWEYEGVPS